MMSPFSSSSTSLAGWLLLLLAALCLVAGPASAAIAPKCMNGRSLSTPTAMPGLVNCPQYRHKACCSLELDSIIIPDANGTQLYGFNWDRCGPMSARCQAFFQAESCYFECDPYMHPWGLATEENPGVVAGVPVCSTYCDAWFEACKDDYTCGVEWLVDFVPLKNDDGEVTAYGCRAGTECKKFSEVYDNAQGLCDILWGAAFHYSEDLKNCVTWDFALTTTNPNKDIEKVPYQENFCNQTYMLSLPPPEKKVEQSPKCLSERELKQPAPQSGLSTCARYSDMSCCGPTTDKLLARDDDAADILGYDWKACGEMSPKCEKYFKEQACYFQCDPYQSRWANPVLDSPSTFIGIPVCADYCDDWFEACKDELTCAVEWLISMTPILNNKNNTVGYTCAADSQCVSISTVYENGRGLCDVMFGADYHYSEDETNCVRWDFGGSNPNKMVQKLPYAEGYCVPEIDGKLVAIVVLSLLFGITLIGLGGFVIYLIYREKKQNPLYGETPMKKLDD